MRLLFGEHDVFKRAIEPASPKRDYTIVPATRERAPIRGERCAIHRTFVRFERPRAALVSEIPNFRRAVRRGGCQKVSSRVPFHVRNRISM